MDARMKAHPRFWRRRRRRVTKEEREKERGVVVAKKRVNVNPPPPQMGLVSPSFGLLSMKEKKRLEACKSTYIPSICIQFYICT